MTDRVRVSDEPAFVLHRRPFRDSSQIVDIFTRHHGRLAVVARGVRSRRSRWRGVLEPFRPLRLGWSAKGDLGTLSAAEPNGPALPLDGRSLYAAFYLNELVLNLTHRHDAQPELYDIYASGIGQLSAHRTVSETLRHVELSFLDELGYGLDLAREAGTGAPLDPDRRYRVTVGHGVTSLPVEASDRGYPGRLLLAVAARQFDSAEAQKCAQRLTRAAIDALLDGRELKTRRVLGEVLRQCDRAAGETPHE